MKKNKISKGRHELTYIRELNREFIEENFELMIQNSKLNEKYWKNKKSINDLIKNRDIFKEKIGVIAAPGPSLSNEIDNIIKFRNYLTVIAIDSAIFPLLIRGIVPDYIFIKNHNELTIELIGKFNSSKFKFIMPISANPELVESIEGDIYFYVPEDDFQPLYKWSKKYKKTGKILLKPSTASMAFIFSLKLNFRAIFLTGFDFAYTNGKYYCDFVKYLAIPDYMESLQKNSNELTIPVKTKGIFLNELYSTTILRFSSEDLFRIIKLHNQKVNIYNSSDGILYNVDWITLDILIELIEKDKENKYFNINFGLNENLKKANEFTSNYMQPIMSKNLIHNYKKFNIKKSIRDIKIDNIEEKTAIVTGAAPSLDDDLEILKKYRDRYLLFSVDAALIPLEKYGIIPDYVLSIDPQTHNSKFLNSKNDEKISLIVPITINPETISKWSGEILFSWIISSSSHIFKLTSFFEELPILLPFGNVGSTALILCKGLKFKNIIITGMDFAYTHDRYYCKNVAHECSELVGRNNLIDFNVNRRKVECYEVIDVRGNKVLTDKQLISYGDMLKNYMKSMGTIYSKIYNSGAGILNNIPLIELEEFFLNEKKEEISE